MNYQQFVSAVEVKVKQQVKEGISVCIQTTMKNNGKNRVGIMVSEKGINVSPTIYLEEYFQQYQKHQSLDRIVKSILKLYQEVRIEHAWETSVLQSFSKMQQKIATFIRFQEHRTGRPGRLWEPAAVHESCPE